MPRERKRKRYDEAYATMEEYEWEELEGLEGGGMLPAARQELDPPDEDDIIGGWEEYHHNVFPEPNESDVDGEEFDVLGDNAQVLFGIGSGDDQQEESVSPESNVKVSLVFVVQSARRLICLLQLIEEFVPLRDEILDQLLALEEGPSDYRCCFHCDKAATHRCISCCGDRWCCSRCMLTTHNTLPFHHVEVRSFTRFYAYAYTCFSSGLGR